MLAGELVSGRRPEPRKRKSGPAESLRPAYARKFGPFTKPPPPLDERKSEGLAEKWSATSLPMAATVHLPNNFESCGAMEDRLLRGRRRR